MNRGCTLRITSIEAVLRRPVHGERIIAEIEELDVVRAPSAARSAFRLLAARPLDAIECRAGLLPQLGAFAALAKGEADDRHVRPVVLVERDGTAAAPHEIS
jgi:hypothetical protein